MSNIGEQSEVDRNNERLRQQREKRARAVRALALHREGRDFLWWLMEQGNPLASSMRYDEMGRSDFGRTAYAEGWRGLGSMLMGEIMSATPDGYILMLSENRNVKTLEEIARERDKPESD